MQAGRDIHITQNISTDSDKPDPNELLSIYLRTVVGLYAQLPLSSLDPAGQENSRVGLEQVYIGLNANAPQLVNFNGQSGQTYSALASVAHNERLVILGDPGSGKSTFLRYLALRFAQARLAPTSNWRQPLSWPVYPVKEDEGASSAILREVSEPIGQDFWPHLPYVPIPIVLRDFAASDFDSNSPTALWDFFRVDLMNRGLNENTINTVQDVLQRGEGFFLLDGVDEVSEEHRPQVWRAIGLLTESAFNQCPWITTCRILSYVDKEAALAKPTGRISLVPLNHSQIERFVDAWYSTLTNEGQITQAKGLSLHNQLIEAATGRLSELAKNPMLLTIMALIQTYYGTLPNERAKLYQICVETLLLRWQQSKEAEAYQLPYKLAELETKQESIERLLWEIGWVAHSEQAERQGAADISEQRVIELAKKHLGSYTKAEAFVAYTEHRAHLLIGRGGQSDRRYSFPHRTFQEYLAGCYLANDRRFGRKAIPLAGTGAPWREVLLLAAGTLVYNQKVGRYVLDALEDILPVDLPSPGDTVGWQRVWRAGEMLAIVGLTDAQTDEVGRELIPKIQRALIALIESSELTPQERSEVGRTLANLEVFRPGVGLTKNDLPDINWCHIEGGEFMIGSDENDTERPYHAVTIPAFEISQYPVTNIQYLAFVHDGGYQKEHYWSEAKALGYWQSGKFKGKREDEDRDKPSNFGSPFDLPNHPVVGVSWYEAVAFCRWLSNKTNDFIRLPTEEEWEKASRGKDGRKYPWGNQENPASRCNMENTNIGTTCAVGIFPEGVSPYQVHDMSGNVWEWCSTIWNKDAYLFSSVNEWELEYLNRDTPRVLRGGAFYNTADDVRCARRMRPFPIFGGKDVGFRVARYQG